jgi:hypothetical protein
MKNIVEYVDSKIDSVLSAPAAWGEIAALEPLILMLLMFRRYAAFGDDDEQELMRRYRKHLNQLLGSSSAGLAGRLSEKLAVAPSALEHKVALGRLEKAVDALQAFVDLERK